jgi:hypothetical protein
MVMSQTSTKLPPTSRPRRGRNLLATGCLAAGVALAAGFLSQAVPPASTNTAAAAPALAPLARPIEAVRVGDRVAAHNPEADQQVRRAPDPDPATWRRLTLRVDRPGVCRFEVELLRPLAWLESEHAAAGRTVRLRQPEMGLDDPAAVLAVGPCPAIRPGPGRVVTGTFAHETEGNLVDVAVDGLGGPIGCTTAHPFWSEDRGRFVGASDLRVGERLRTERAGVRRVTALTPRPGRAVVYNLEVDAEHAYFVSPWGVLVHNSSPSSTPVRAPDGARVLETDPGGRWVRYEGPDGQPRLRFRADEARTAAPPRDHGPTPDAEAGVNTNGDAFVVEGRHRAVGTANEGATVPPELGGVPEQPGVLDYPYYPDPIHDPGRPIRGMSNNPKP